MRKVFMEIYSAFIGRDSCPEGAGYYFLSGAEFYTFAIRSTGNRGGGCSKNRRESRGAIPTTFVFDDCYLSVENLV